MKEFIPPQVNQQPNLPKMSGKEKEFFAIINQDLERITEISEISDSDERRKKVGEHIKNILSTLENGTRKDFVIALERLEFLKYCKKISRKEFGSSWQQESIDKLVAFLDSPESQRADPALYFQFSGKIAVIFEVSDLNERSGANPEKAMPEENTADLLAKSLAKKIKKEDTLSPMTQRLIATLSNKLDDAHIESKIDFFLSAYDQPDKLLSVAKEEIVAAMAVTDYGTSSRMLEQVETFLKESKGDVYKSLKALEMLEYAEELSRSEVSHKRIYKRVFEIVENLSKTKGLNFFTIQKASSFLSKLKYPDDPRYSRQPADLRKVEHNPEYAKKVDLMWDYGDLEPLVPKDMSENQKYFFHHSCAYRKLNNKYGVIYSTDNKVNSFFELIDPQLIDDYKKRQAELHKKMGYAEMCKLIGEDPNPHKHTRERQRKFDKLLEKPKPKHITLDEILKKEGFSKESLSEKEYEKITLTYKSLLNLSFRTSLENYFEVSFSDLSVREQIQFIRFLSTKNSIDIMSVGDFLRSAQDERAKINRMRSFLSFEFDQKMEAVFFGKKDYSLPKDYTPEDIALPLGTDPAIEEKTKDKIFAAYAEFVDNAEKTTEEILRITQEIFPEKRLDKKLIYSSILKKAGEIFRNAQISFLGINVRASVDKEEWQNNKRLGADSAERLVNYVKQEKDKIIDNLMEEIKNEQEAQTKALEEFKEINNKIKSLVIKIHFAAALQNAGINIDEIESEKIKDSDYEEMLIKFGYFPINDARDLFQVMLSKKYSSGNIQKEIEFYKNYGTASQNKITPGEEERLESDEEFSKNLERTKKLNKQALKFNLRQIKNLEKLLQYQINLEQKLEELVYGKESAVLLEKIFAKYKEITVSMDSIRPQLDRIFENKDIPQEILDNIHLNMLAKADEILTTFNHNKESYKETLGMLEKYKSDQLQSLSIFKAIQEKGLEPEEVGIDYFETTAEKLSENKKEIIQKMGEEIMTEFDQRYRPFPARLMGGATQEFFAGSNKDSSIRMIWDMFDAYATNWQKYPERGKLFLGGFISKIINDEGKTKIFAYKQGEEVLVYLRIDDQPDGRKYFGSFNALSTLKGLAVGSELLQKVLETECRGKDVFAVCVPQEAISTVYVEKFDFVIDGIDLDVGETGKEVLKITRSEKNKAYKFKSGFTKNQIVELHEKENSENKILAEADYFILRIERDSDELKTTIDRLVNHGKHNISRYFFAGDNGRYAYFVFEKKI
jgi:hypothetical protein